MGSRLKKKEIILYFHIEEDWRQTCYYSKRVWKFQQIQWFDIMNYPEKANIFCARTHDIGPLVRDYYSSLTKEMLRKNKKIQSIQAELYPNQLHIRYLPYWFYYPGISILGSKVSDIFIKIIVWQELVALSKQTLCWQDVQQGIKKILLKRKDLFYTFPNVSTKEMREHCLNQLFISLIECHHLVRRQQGWYVDVCSTMMKEEEMHRLFKTIENKQVIRAIPIKNMIE